MDHHSPRRHAFGWTLLAASALVSSAGFVGGCQQQRPLALGSDVDRLSGAWTGTLTYRDYTSNQPVSIPTNLHVAVAGAPEVGKPERTGGPARVVSFMRRYPDEPNANKVQTVELSRNGRRFGSEVVTARLEPAPGVVILETRERGSDNDRPALLRYTYTITPDMFVASKDVWNAKDKFFENRNVSRYVREGLAPQPEPQPQLQTQSQPQTQSEPAPKSAEALPVRPLTLVMPEAAKPHDALVPLAFMAGGWVCVNPNKTVNDEQWTPPRGNSMAALFRQMRADGSPAFHEASVITAEPDGVYLRLRHMHAQLEVPDESKELSVFKLVSAGNNRAQFTGVGKSESVSSVVYRLDGENTLVVEVSFAESSKEKGYTLRYTRVR